MFSLVGHRFEVQQSSVNSCCAKKKTTVAFRDFMCGVLSQKRSWCFTNYLYPVGLPEGKGVTIATLMGVQI